MRVITGSARGTRLETPDGNTTRPTAERVKEGVFSAIQFDVEGRKVLDLFSGTGQMGIEALSRGAESAVFVDSDRGAVELIKKNLAKTHLEERAEVRLADYRATIQGLGGAGFGIVFIDPPYGTGQLQRALETISKVDILVENGIIICESDRDEELPKELSGLEPGRVYVYGQTKISLYKHKKA